MVVFLQETMSSREAACDFFLKLHPGWFVSAIDACGNYKGTLVGWNPVMADIWPFITCVVLLLKGRLKGLDSQVHLLNVYDPYSQRISFWDCVKAGGILTPPKLILVGDLNFTWSAEEVWGPGWSIDPLSDYFHAIF